MGIYSAYNVGRLALAAQQTALQVTGQNIANANNADYTRQRVVFQATPPDNLGFAQLGTGVSIADIQRVMDSALNARLNTATSTLGSMQAQQTALSQLESIFNALGDSSLSNAMGEFFDSLDALSANPADSSVRREVLAAGDAVSQAFNALAVQMNQQRANLNDSVKIAVSSINGLAQGIADLNRQIVAAEAGGADTGKANDLRDQRDALLKQLSGYISVNASESDDGALNILVGSEWLVFGKNAYSLTTSDQAENGVTISKVEYEQTGGEITATGGSLQGLMAARDQALPEFINDVAALAGSLINQVNMIHNQGQGLERLTSATSESQVSGPLDALNAAGLYFTPSNGSFNIDVYNKITGEVKTVSINVNLTGAGSDTTLQSLVDEINNQLSAAFGGASPVSAQATITNRLSIQSGDGSYDFAFSNDTSGLLAALGMNNFFSGHDALSMGLSDNVADNPNAIAAARSASAGDNSNALALAGLRNANVMDNGAATLDDFYQGIVGSLGVQSAAAQDQADNQNAIVTSLENQRQSISGVNIDEETINLMLYERAYQAAAKYISIVDSLLDTLINAT